MRISDWSSDVCSSDLDRVARTDERAHVRDRVVHPVAVANALDEHRLVQVHRVGWIDADQRQVRAVLVGQARIGRRAPRRLLDFGRESVWQLQLFPDRRSEEHTSELQSLMRISYAVFFLKKK